MFPDNLIVAAYEGVSKINIVLTMKILSTNWSSQLPETLFEEFTKCTTVVLSVQNTCPYSSKKRRYFATFDDWVNVCQTEN